MDFVKDIIAYLLVFAIVICINIFVVTISSVSGPSMEPNFKSKDLIFIEKLSVKFDKLKRFNIVTVDKNESKAVIKRIVALPGETIYYKDNNLYINDEIVSEDFLEENTITEDTTSITLSDDEYFVIGDNRTNSIDSRSYGAITTKNIIGKYLIRIWPLK